MKTLVTGGAGFIGSHTVDLLLAQGRDVRVYDVLVDQVHQGSAPRYLPAEVEFVHADVRDRTALAGALRGVDEVVHLAAEVGVGQSMYEISRYVEANTAGTGVLLDILANDRHHVQKIVVASSMSIYGEGAYECIQHGAKAPRQRRDDHLVEQNWEPRCEECGSNLVPRPTPESKPLYPTSVYAISKLDQESLCLSVGAAYGIGVTALRFFNTYGPRQALSNPYTGVAAIFSARLLSGQSPIVMEDGQQRRDFIHVYDVAQAVAGALSSHQVDGEAINIGTGQPISINAVAALIAAELGRGDLQPEVTRKYRAGDIRHCWADPSLAAKLLGFRSAIDFAEVGVKQLVAWVAEQVVERPGDPTRELVRRGLAW
jgi:dTDP-L-rhamnose 4-epimerase